MFTLLIQRRLRWLEHVHRIADGKVTKDLGYRSIAQVVDFLNGAGPKTMNT